MNNEILITVNKKTPNFGDYISDIFFNLLSGKNMVAISFKNDKIESYLTTGSHLRLCNENHTIIGSGFISENDDLGKGDWKFTNKVYKQPKKIISVRGPKTREKLLQMNIDCPESYGDPLFIFPLIYNPDINVKYKIGIIPHFIDKTNKNFINLQKKFKAKIINIETGDNYKKFINDIKECEFIISSTLHGVIISLAYSKKTIWTKFSNKVIGGDFKFQDFFSSLNIIYTDPNCNDPNIIDKSIKVDKNNMIKLGLNILNSCPFIENETLNELKNKWIEYLKNYVACY
jgi:pyruvyltransferase